ncbi:unnamed protein product [Rotaria sordida]|uniref:Protein VAC14 homolog n=1 Tax=Rotaria sordida TaxID=392033 RepID=A0A815C2K1_9BILA|nr:unnamed protein product [Rotaria sordida]CAF1556978.1 unnamed protein product [Rotaria sordida]
MSDRDYLPLSATLVKTLTDKLYEKRKAAALEIEKMVRELIAVQNYEQIERICKILSEHFVLSQNGNFRRGGLIGIAALAIACGREAQRFKSYLVPPVLQCFLDNDPKVRYYACESLYNIAKVLRTITLSYFNEIFDCLSKLVCDLEPTVKSGAELCDRLLKDIVIETCTQFEVIAFIPLLRERIYVRNAFTRQFIVSWVSLLTSVPEFDMVQYLPEIMDGLFHILGDPNPEIRKSCEILFSEFLTILKTSQVQPDMFEDMTRILIQNSQSSDDLIQYTALHWLREFLNMPKCHQVLLPHSAGLLSAVLPCFSYEDDNRQNILFTFVDFVFFLFFIFTAKEINSILRQLIKNESTKKSNESNAIHNLPDMTITKMVEVLKTQIQSGASPSRIIALGWVHHLFECLQDQMASHIDVLFPTLFRVLSDPSDEAVLLVLQVFALISTSNRTNTDRNYNDYFTKFIIVLMDLFRTDRSLLEARGSFIIRQLCMLLSPEDIYKTLSETLANEPDTNFASIMVKILSSILLTSTELHDLRIKLKNLQTIESADLFVCLYKTWCHNPVALVALCFLSQNYDHACTLVQLFAEIEVTVDFLIEIDKLVQLLESPIFTYLRLALLDVENNQTLIRALCGLLMLLPGKTDAFHVLRRRLECVPNFIDKFTSIDKRLANLSINSKEKETINDPRKNINFDELQQYYLSIQNRHIDLKKQRYRYAPTSDVRRNRQTSTRYLDKMTMSAPKSPLPQFVCQVCGNFLQQDSSLETIDDQMTKPIASSTTICDESYNELQQGGSDGTIVIRKTLGRKRFGWSITTSQSSLDSANGFALVPHDVNKDLEQKSMREYRNDINIHEKLYDFLSEQYTFDHPLCQECTDTLLDKLDVDLQMATHELTSYKKLLEQLNSSTNVQPENYEKLKQELIELDEEEKRIKDELLKLEQENQRLQNESEQLKKDEQSLEEEEIRYLRDYNEQKRLLFEAEDEQKSIDNQTKHARAQYEKLSKTNAFNAAFHIWHQEHFGTINGFRLGRLPSINVEWSEINAGLGQAALLLNSLAKRIDLQFIKYKIIPLGSHSYIEDLNERKNGKFVQLPLYTGRRHLTWDNQFNKALIAFLDCVNQFKLAIESKNQRFCLPYKMNEKKKGVITDSNGYQFHVSYQVGSQEEWTKALKYMLTNLKWGLTWITSQLPDDMTTSNAIPTTSSPTVTSPR